jgi:SAM-dependent methyltransferase
VRQYCRVANQELAAWKRLPSGEAGRVLGPTESVQYGPDVATERDLRLLGHLAGKRVLELGCGAGQSLVVMAREGAHAIGLDPVAGQLAAARRLAEQEGVKVELHQGDLADLAFMRGDSIDLVLSAYSLAFEEDINRVFRQVHRVLKEGAPMVFSLPHPAYDLIDDREDPLVVRHSYFARATSGGGIHRTFSELFTGLFRAKLRIDAMLEPQPADAPRSHYWREAARLVPRTLIVRARKEGI